MLKQTNKFKQFILIFLSFLMIFGNVTVANATVNHDNNVVSLYVNISDHFEEIENQNGVAKRKSKGYEKVEH